MRFEFKLPDIGEGMVEGEIVKWYVRVGEEIHEDAPMVDVMTDKATVTIGSPKAGKVLEISAKEGEIKKVGAVLIAIEVAGVESKETPSAPQSSSTHSSTPVRHAPADGDKNKEAGNGDKQSEGKVSTQTYESGSKVLASPATRRLAQELGVDLSRVSGTGPGGRITHEDVQGSLKRQETRATTSEKVGRTSEKVTSTASQGGEERIPFRGMRRKIAEKMVISKTKVPHYTYVEEADMSELVLLREKTESQIQNKNIKVTYLPFIVKAVAEALKKHPTLNSVLDEEHQEIVVKKEYNIGLGAATPDGLTVFVVKNADQKNIGQLALEIQDLAEKARTGKLSVDELQGSTFTITSLGALGGMFATPIINYPEVAILGIHRIEKRPVVRDNQIVIRDMMYVSLSFDHRVIDGDVGARFANEVIQILQHPASLF